MRPKIICHMVSSIDGRLIVKRWTPPASGIDRDMLLDYYEEVAGRFEADGWIVGRKTMEELIKVPTRIRTSAPAGSIGRAPYVAESAGRKLAIGIDPHGRVHYGANDIGGDHIVAVLGERVSDVYLAELREGGLSYVFAGPDGHDLHQAMDTIGKAFGVRTLLLEGGGGINGAFLKAGLIDEISLLVYPGVDGLAGVPSIFEYVGRADERPAAGLSLGHVASETLEGGIVWLRYLVEAVPEPN